MTMIKELSQEEIKDLESLYTQYNTVRTKKTKNKRRDQLYDRLQPRIILTIKTFLSKRKSHMTEQEILSLSWDCFLRSLDRYKQGDHNIIQHFHSYTIFGMLKHYESQKTSYPHLPYTDMRKYLMRPPRDIDLLSTIDELKTFYDTLPPPDQIIFEDALLSTNKKKGPRRIRESGFLQNKYAEIKRVFMGKILHMLRDHEQQEILKISNHL